MRKLFYLVVSIVIFGLIISGCFFHVVPPLSQDGSIDIVKNDVFCKIDLIAGQHTVAGSVTVSNDGENLFVTYETVDNWLINETHLYVGTTIPTNSAPGKFPYKHEELGEITTDTYVIPLEDLGVGPCDDIVYIAAHAELVKGGKEEGGWAEGTEIRPGKNWAMYFNYQVWPCGSEIPELTEAISQNIDLSIGGTIEVDDPGSIINGVKLIIPPIPSEKKGGKLIANITISYIDDPYSLELPDNRGFLLPPVVINSDVILEVECILEIPYTEANLSNMGLSSNENIKMYRYNYNSSSWEEILIKKRSSRDMSDILEIIFMPGDIDSPYACTFLNADPPSDLGLPQPGDLLYKLSNYKGVEGWIPGHVGIYVGEKAYDGVIPYNVIEALLDGVKRTYYNPISKFSGSATYMGARQPKSGALTSKQREDIVDFLDNDEVVGKPYAIGQSFPGILFGMLRGNLVKGALGTYNCVGLAEAAYEKAEVNGGIGLVSDEAEGNYCPISQYSSSCVLTPAEQYNKTEPAKGYIDIPEIGAWTITGYDPYCIKTFEYESIPDRSIVVHWPTVAGAEEYRVYRSVNGNSNFSLVYSGDYITDELDVDDRVGWYDFDTTPGNSYSYKVSCVINGQESATSDPVTRSVWLPECSLASPPDYNPEDPNYQPVIEPDPLLEWNPVGVSSYPYQGDIQSGESQIWVVAYNTPYPEVNQGEQIWNESFNDLTTSSTRFDPSTPLIPGPDSIHAWESKGVGFDDNGNILAISWSGARHFFYMEAPDVILPPVHNLTQNTYYDTIQIAIDDADSGDNIEVSPGTYYENINFLGKDITLRSTDPDDPSVVESTIIDGGGNGNVIIFSNNETAQAVLNGFTIQDGTADYNGGGIWVIGSSPTIKNNTITRNSASDCGGGIGVYEGSPLINDNIITNNTAEYCGGGIWISDHSSPTIENNTIAGNTATLDSGGGIHIYRYSSSNIRNNTISNNTATNVGGGIGISDNSSPTIEGNTISNNSSANNGGGLYIDGSSSVKTTNGSTWPRQNTPPNTESTNTYSDNTHGNPLDYTEGADVYMEGAITPINGDITNVSPLTDPFTLGTWYTTYVYVKNTGNTSHTFKVIASEPSGTDFEITEKSITLSAGATNSLSFKYQFYGTETCRSLTFYLYDNSGNLLDTKQTGTLCPITLNAVITNIRDIVAGSLIDPFELNKWYTAVVHISVDYNGPDSGIIEVKPKPDSGIEYDPIVKEFPYDKYTLGGSRGFDYKFVGSGTTRQLTFELYDQATGIKLDEYTSETLHLMQPDPNLDYIESIPSSTNLQYLHPFGFPQDYVIKAHFDDGHIETWTDFNKFNFESSDIYIVNVHENYGSMYGTGVGTATITITYKEDTSKKAYLSVTVY